MAAEQQLIIQVQAQISNAQSQLAAVQNQVRGLGTAAQGVVAPISNMGKAFSAFLGGAAFAAIERIVRSLVDFSKAAVEAFTKADAAAKEFQNTLVQRGLSVADALSASNAVGGLAVNVGLEPEEIQQGISSLMVKLGDGKKAVAGFGVALDSMRVLGGSFATAVQRVGIAAEGSLKSLRQFGVTTVKDANGNLKTMNELLKEMGTNMKGGLATYLQTPLGMIDRLKVSVQELKESFGKMATDAFGPVAKFATGFAGEMVVAFAAANGMGGSLNSIIQLEADGARVAKGWVDIWMNIKLGILEVQATLWAGLNPEMNQAVQDQIQNIKDTNAELDKNIFAIETSTPESNVADYFKKLDELMAKAQGDGTTAAATTKAAWEAAFAPLKLLSGSIPNLAKYVGNLSSSFVLKTELKITVEDKTPASHTPSGPLSPSVAGAVHEAVQKSLRTATRGVVNAPLSRLSSHAAGGWQSILDRGSAWGGN